MRGFWAVTLISFRTWFRDRTSVFWGVLFPILLMGLIGAVFGGEGGLSFRVSVATSAEGPLVDGLVDALEDVPVFEIVRESEDAALSALAAGQRSLVVVVSGPDVAALGGESGPGAPDLGAFGEAALDQDALEAGGPPPAELPPMELLVYYDEGNSQVNQVGISIVQQVVDGVNKELTGRRDVISLSQQGIAAHKLSMFDFLLPGMIAMTLMQTGLMGVTYVVANYRETKLLKRVLTTALHPFAFLSGLVARFTVVNIGQAAIIFLVGTYVYGAKTVGSVLHLLVLGVIGSVAFLALGFLISTISKSAEAANALGSLVNFPMLFLSGTFWPREMLPDAMQPIVGALPLSPLVEAMRGVSTAGHSLLDYTPGILYLLAWTAVCFAVGAWRFRWE